jgi:ATP-binding cassette subfamily B multidrug efflux pump
MGGPRAGGRLRSLAKDERPADTWATVRRLLDYLAPYRMGVAVALVWVVIAAAAQAAGPVLTGYIVNIATKTTHLSDLVLPFLGLIAAATVGWLATRAQIMALGTIGQRALRTVRLQVFDKISDLSVAFFERNESGDLMSRLINDVDTINGFLSNGFRRLLGSAVGLVMTLAVMLAVNWVLALATLLVVPVMFAVSRLFGLVARRAFRLRQETLGDISSTLAEELAGIKVAQAFARTDRNATEFEQRNADNRDASVAASAVSSAFSPVLDVISTMSLAVVAGLGGYLATRNIITIGVVVAFIGFSRQFFNAVSQLSSLYADTQSALAGGERIFGLLDTRVEVSDAADALELGRLGGEVEYRGVRFSYGDGPEVLHGIDLHVAPGETVAIVGPTGAGKSTIVNLLARFYDPTSGAVLVDGNDLTGVVVGSLRRNLGIVLQDPFLFSGTVADNIRYGRLEASDADLAEAARTARGLEFIERLPAGFDTQVGERGGTLSTGQRQLIAFARAILADPAILILDEATSSVDTRTEALIQEGLRAILSDRTALVIAHRLSTVRDADRIAVVDAGAVVELGTYAELMAANELFRRLHDAQFVE